MARILLVDDENLILYSLSKTLKNDGSEVKAVANGKDALTEIRNSPYDILFLDVNLPDANGLELMKIVREISPSTRVVIMTAVDLNDGQMKYVHSNDGYFLPKPFDLDEVRSIVHDIDEPSKPPTYNARCTALFFLPPQRPAAGGRLARLIRDRTFSPGTGAYHS